MDFNINIKAKKMIEAFEKSPKTRLVCWGVIILTGMILFLKPVAVALIEKLL